MEHCFFFFPFSHYGALAERLRACASRLNGSYLFELVVKTCCLWPLERTDFILLESVGMQAPWKQLSSCPAALRQWYTCLLLFHAQNSPAYVELEEK